MLLSDKIKKEVDELTRSRLSDAYLLGQSWSDIALQFPSIDQSIYQEIIEAIETRLNITAEKIKPATYYRGIGIEADSHQQGLIVSEVYKACPAAQLGVQVGDVISKVKVNQIWLDLNGMDLRAALKHVRQSDSIEGVQLEIIRAGEKIILGEGLNIKTKVIDAKRKYLMNFTATTLGRKLLKMQISNEASGDMTHVKNLASKQTTKTLQIG